MKIGCLRSDVNMSLLPMIEVANNGPLEACASRGKVS
jgi:hypothetical protein